jgi:hypothetical protein
LTGLINSDERDDLRRAMLHLGPKRVYSGCLWHAQQKGHKPGFAAYCFLELYGMWPRSRDRTGVPQRVDAVEAWMTKRPKPPRRKQ